MKIKDKLRVAIIIPAFNEAKVISDVIKRLKKTLAKEKFSYEIILVDDGSTDDTVKKSKKEKIIVISHILNSGKGKDFFIFTLKSKDSSKSEMVSRL